MDTSGVSNPWACLPDDIFPSLWDEIYVKIKSGIFAMTTEIYEESEKIGGQLGEVIMENKSKLIVETNIYLDSYLELMSKHDAVISERNNNRKNTVGVADISIIALGKTIDLPVVTMETPSKQISDSRKRIPEICKSENVKWLNFNGFLKEEGIRL